MNYVERKRIELARKCVFYGKYEYAELIIKKLLEENDKDAELFREIGMLYIGMGHFVNARNALNSSFELEKSVETLDMLANVNFELQNYEDAAIQYEELTKHTPTELIYNNCSKAYQGLDLYDESIRIAKESYKKYDNVIALSDLFFKYVFYGMEKESIECAEELKRKYPNHSITYNALGFLYETILNDYEQAKKYFEKAAKHGYIESYYNLGVCCKQSEDYAGAEKYLKKLISLKTDSKMDYNYSLGSVYMAERKLRLGYKYYQNRKSAQNLNYRNRKHLWDGKDYPNETLYVSSEQGFGDNIMFLRYLPIVAKKFKKVIYDAHPNLVDLFKNSLKNLGAPNLEIVPNGTILRYNKFVLIMDLPYLLHMNFHNIPAKQNYLECDKAKQEEFKTKYFENDKKKIGLCWRAKGMAIRDAVYRTIDAPYYFKPLFDIPNTQFYSVQIGDIFGMCEKYPQIIDVSGELNDFNDTAAILKNLDILITVDTAVAHLAGALGVKTYLLLCHAPDWRWFDNDKKTEWYPSVHIIKQQDRRTWEDVAETLNKAIIKECK